MASVRSTLIRACKDSICQQLEQLEQWLNTVPESTSLATAPLVTAPLTTAPLTTVPLTTVPLTTAPLTIAIERLTKQFEVQQHALNHIVDRLDILEGMRDRTSYLPDEPWLDGSLTQLQNEIIDPIEPIYTVHKTDTLFEPPPITIEVKKQEPNPVDGPVEEAEAKHEEQPATVVEEAKKEEQPAIVVAEAKREEQPATVVAEAKREEKSAIVEEEEEEDEEDTLEIIEYKGTSYYKDTAGFIYRIDEDQQPSETADGFWKEKTQSIVFYKK